MRLRGSLLYMAANLFFALFMVQGIAQASPNELPNNDIMGSSDIFLEVSQVGTLNGLDAPVAYSRFYFDNNTPFSVGVFDGCYNQDSGLDGSGMNQSCTDSATYRTVFRFCTEDANGNSTGNCTNVNGQQLNRSAWEDFNLSLGGAQRNAAGKYTVRMQAYFEVSGPSGGRVNAFKVRANGAGAFASYWADNSGGSLPFAVQRRFGGDPNTEDNYTFEFQMPCELTAPSPERLRWRDADHDGAGGAPPDDGINWVLIDDTAGGAIVASASGAAAMGGNNQYREQTVTFQPSHKYRWQWRDVRKANGVQLWVPFDSFNYYRTCSPPPPPPPTADCMPPWDNPVRNVSLPNGGAPVSTHTARVSYTGRTTVDSVRDEWNQNNSSYTDTGNNSVTVDYRPWFNAYKYDYHTPNVRYRAEYRVDYYNEHDHPYTYSCPIPSNPSRTCTGSNHEEHYTGSSTSYGSPQEATGERSLCRYRNFNFIDTSNQPSPKTNGVQWYSNPNANEEPNYVSFGSNYNVRFTLNYGVTPLRTPMRINYAATAVYQRDRNGLRTPWPYGRESGAGCNNLFSGSASIGSTGVPATLTSDYRDCFVALIAPPILQAGDRACFTMSLGYSQGELNPEGNIVSSSGSRSFNDCSEQLVDKPYFRVFGGDVIAGTTAFDNCIYGNGQINAWNRGSKPANSTYGNSQWGGAGTQLAAYANQAIDQFVSAQTRGTNPIVPKELTFANDTAATYGGNWAAGNIPCQTNYYSMKPTTGFTDPGGSADLNGGSDEIFVHTGDLVITGGNIPQGRKKAVYVDGDIEIRQDIRYVGMYNGADRVPSVRIIARGNIYIAPNVQQIDGILIAQPNGATGGTIVTCSDGNFGLPTVAQVNGGASSCRNRLEIFGALIARDVRFLRSQGSIRNSNNGHNYNNATIAESIIFTPEVWLADPAYKPPYREPYEAFTSLPPIL